MVKLNTYIRRIGTLQVSPDRFGIVRLKPISELPQTDTIEVVASGLNDDDNPSREAKGHTVPVLPEVMDYISRINTPDGDRYAKSFKMFWSNRRYQGDALGPPYHDEFGAPFDKYMMAECVTGVGNIHRVIGENATHWMLESFPYDFPFSTLDPKKFNWEEMPWLFWRMLAQKGATGELFNVWGGVECNVPLIGQKRPLWIFKKNFEMFQQPPFIINGKKVVSYKFKGSDISGITETGEVIPLLVYAGKAKREFPTSWRITNPSALPAREKPWMR
jgi:hypothetical protein